MGTIKTPHKAHATITIPPKNKASSTLYSYFEELHGLLVQSTFMDDRGQFLQRLACFLLDIVDLGLPGFIEGTHLTSSFGGLDSDNQIIEHYF